MDYTDNAPSGQLAISSFWERCICRNGYWQHCGDFVRRDSLDRDNSAKLNQLASDLWQWKICRCIRKHTNSSNFALNMLDIAPHKGELKPSPLSCKACIQRGQNDKLSGESQKRLCGSNSCRAALLAALTGAITSDNKIYKLRARPLRWVVCSASGTWTASSRGTEVHFALVGRCPRHIK